MIPDATNNSRSDTTTVPLSQPSRDTIHYVCRALNALAWVAIILWLLTPKGTHWASGAGDAGLAWILLTGGGYLAEKTVRSFVICCKASLVSRHEETTCRNEEYSTKWPIYSE